MVPVGPVIGYVGAWQAKAKQGQRLNVIFLMAGGSQVILKDHQFPLKGPDPRDTSSQPAQESLSSLYEFSFNLVSTIISLGSAVKGDWLLEP